MQEAAVRLGWRWLQRQLCSRKGRSHSMMRMLGWGRLSYLSSLWAWTDDDDLSILFLVFLSLPRCSSSCFHHKIYSANLPLFLSHFLAVLLTFLRLLLSSLCSPLPSAFTAHGEADCFPKLDGAFLPSSCLDFQVTRLHNMDPMLCQAVEGRGVGGGWAGAVSQQDTSCRPFSPPLFPCLYPSLECWAQVCLTAAALVHPQPGSQFSCSCRSLKIADSTELQFGEDYLGAGSSPGLLEKRCLKSW